MTDGLIARGCWGSPHFVVDEGEMFWGNDKRWELNRAFLAGEYSERQNANDACLAASRK